jgi:hypothetical protein
MLKITPVNYRKTFADMHTRHLQEWLKIAQNDLPSRDGASRDILIAGITAAANELLFRWKYNL